MNLKKLIKKYYNQGNVCVDGLRGRGKDMLTSNIIYQRGNGYISNLDYHCKTANYTELDFDKLDVKNSYDNFINGDIVYYDYPYNEKEDIYISDSQLYFPSQYCNELNKRYPRLPNFFALSRQLGLCNIHINTQNLNRLWDKIREQSDYYIKCNKCIVLFGKIVIQTVTIYDKYQSCIDRVEPFRSLQVPMFAKGETCANFKLKNEELFRSFKQNNGMVKRRTLVYINRSNYDTRYFKSLLLGGVKVE